MRNGLCTEKVVILACIAACIGHLTKGMMATLEPPTPFSLGSIPSDVIDQ